MTGKARLNTLASKLQAAKTTSTERGVGEPAKHGEKGEYPKYTVTLPPEIGRLVGEEVLRRKLARLPEPTISAVIRDALIAHLTGKGGK